MYKFIDLFAGIGGIRMGFERAGCECIWSSEWNKYSQLTYAANFGEMPRGDITKIKPQQIPSFDILCAGFPCQPFSIAGVSKKKSLGRKHGFEDKTQGTLFFDVARILEYHKPAAFLLENVKNLKHHDKGNTFNIIHETLEDDLGYSVFAEVINAKNLVPQNRARIYIAGFRDKNTKFNFPEIPDEKPRLRGILEKNVPDKYTLTDHLWNYLKKYREKHRKAGNGFGFGLADIDGISRTLSARYHKDGSEILIPQEGKNPRRLTPRECARLQGFADTFRIPVSDTQAYRQFGNSVAVPVVEKLAGEIVNAMQKKKVKKTTGIRSISAGTRQKTPAAETLVQV